MVMAEQPPTTRREAVVSKLRPVSEAEPPEGFYDEFDHDGPGYPAATAEQLTRGEAPNRRTPSTLAEVAHRWRDEGALVHEPTGIPALDELTGGGPVYGTRWYLLGAPDAGKTALLAQLADQWQARGVVIGILAVDEEDSDLALRFAQRRKFSRAECEQRSDDTLRELDDAFAKVDRVLFYDADWTIEASAKDLAERAKAIDPSARAALLIDSVQTVRCAAVSQAERELTERQVVSSNVRAIRHVSTLYRLIVLATSEMNRNAYRSVKNAEEQDDMAAAKESGAVEYSARVMLAMRSIKDHGELVEVRAVKNKHGPRWPVAAPVFLSIDRARMTLASSEKPDESDDEETAKADQIKGKATAYAALIAPVLARHPGLPVRRFRDQANADCGIGKDYVGVALARLGAAVVERPGKRGAKYLYLDGSRVPAEVMALVPLELRPNIARASAFPEGSNDRG